MRPIFSSKWSGPRVRLHAAIACMLLFVLSGCGSGFRTEGTTTTVSLSPLATEDLTGPCVFDLLLQEPAVVQAGTLVIYERGDTQDLYTDATLRQAVLLMHYSILWVHECDSAKTGDFQADATKGPGRMLFAALNQLATLTNRPEVATNGVVLYGFSAAGVLTATIANLQPQRLLGAVEYADGSAYVNLEQVPVSAGAAQIPTLVLANATDPKSGTYRSLDYFTRGRLKGAPWAFGVQNNTVHCCSLSTRKLLVPFLQAIAASQTPTPPNAPAAVTASFPGQTVGAFTCTPNSTIDAQGYTNCSISTASTPAAAPATGTYGWLPDKTTAATWLAWVLNPTTN